MRKIISKYEESKIRRRNRFLAGSVLIFVMLFSIIGYSFTGRVIDENNSNSINYNGFEFVKQNGFWNLNLNGVNYVFSYNPKEIQDISDILGISNTELNVKNLDNYKRRILYIHSEDGAAFSEIRNNLFPAHTQGVQSACLEGEICADENLPIKTCDENFIIIKESEEEKIVQDNNCVFIEGKKENLLKLTDSFLFEILGIN